MATAAGLTTGVALAEAAVTAAGATALVAVGWLSGRCTRLCDTWKMSRLNHKT